jgi:hypothetical protein
MDQQGAQVAVAALGDRQHHGLVTSVAVTWNQSQIGAEVAAVPELLAFSRGRDQGGGSYRTDTFNLEQSATARIIFCDARDAAVVGLDLPPM